MLGWFKDCGEVIALAAGVGTLLVEDHGYVLMSLCGEFHSHIPFLMIILGSLA